MEKMPVLLEPVFNMGRWLIHKQTNKISSDNDKENKVMLQTVMGMGQGVSGEMTVELRTQSYSFTFGEGLGGSGQSSDLGREKSCRR